MIIIKTLFKKISIAYLIFSIFVFSCIIYYDYKLPDRYTVTQNENLSFSMNFVNTNNINQKKAVSANASNNDKKTLNFMGIIPIKQVSVKENPQINLTPVGKQFGIKMFTTGAMVVGISDIQTDKGLLSPAKNANIKEGDIILSVNDQKIERNEDIANIISNSNGEQITVNLKRNDELLTVKLTPVLSNQDNKYKSGIWVRDSAAGIGTITYIDDKNMSFAGLGHGICDIDTGKIMPVGSGEICNVSIHNIKKGKAGSPGELIGAFTSDESIGLVKNNNQTGIYGKLTTTFETQKSYPLAYKQEVKIGDATILCALQDETPKEYSIKITSIDYNPKSEVKNMTIKVTDEELLQKTGGIIQGMSGTPILQNNKIIGAVTHVLVNDSKKGYGIFAENMYKYSSQIN